MGHSSASRVIVVGLVVAQLLIIRSTAGSDEAGPAPHGCFGGTVRGSNWAYGVEQVLCALEATTPNRPSLSYNYGYPAYTTGNPGGSATCRTAPDIADCEQCLSSLRAKLQLCTNYAAGGLDNVDCNMMFWEIP